MSLLTEIVRRDPGVRSELVMALLRMGRFEEAQAHAIPLVGTPYQAWFLYVRAWNVWRQGHQEVARCLLSAALELRGSAATGPAEFLSVEGRPLIAAEFSSFSPPSPGPLPSRPCWLGGPLTPFEAGCMLRHLRPVLGLCALNFRMVRLDQVVLFEAEVWRSLRSWPELISMAERLWVLHRDHPSSLAVTACAAFYLNLAERHEDALFACQPHLLRRPHSPLIRPLKMVALYRLGRRREALNIGETMLREPPDQEGLGCLVLGLLAHQTGNPAVASRFYHEAMNRGPQMLAVSLDQQL